MILDSFRQSPSTYASPFFLNLSIRKMVASQVLMASKALMFLLQVKHFRKSVTFA